MGKNPDVIEATHMVLHLMKAGMAIYGYPAVAIHRGMVQKNGELYKSHHGFLKATRFPSLPQLYCDECRLIQKERHER